MHIFMPILLQNVELVGDGNMQNLLIEGELGMPAVSVTGGTLKLSNLMVRSVSFTSMWLIACV